MKGANPHHVSLQDLDVDTAEEREKRLDQFLDTQLMAKRAREVGLEENPTFKRRVAEFRKTRLINLYRASLTEQWQPSDEELKAYFKAHEDEIVVPEARKVQIVVLKTKQEAEDIKQKIESGEMTIYQAAMNHSIDPSAKRTLGEIGWVEQGTGFPELDELTFFLEPGVLGGPVESPNGWHLVKVLEVRDPQFLYFEQQQTRTKTLRMYMHEKMDDYVVGLRRDKFKVEVDDAKLTRLFQEEADWIASLKAKSEQEGSVTQERVKDLEKWFQP
jgi:peptidyl-prolyl cis-trans isomerase C